MIKIVNVKPVLPIMALRTPILGEVLNCKMSDGDILQCIYSRAFVDEVLEDGTLVRLNLTNYNKDNSHLMKNKVKEEVKIVKEEVKVEKTEELEVKMEEKVVEPVVETEEPVVVVEEATTAEDVKQEEEQPVVEQQRDRKNNKKNKR